ncbi:MAG: diguanylate cyclase [Phycisphaerae bacterium]|nr:diguanylate cyclase [Phycisphaerae bacterium]
MSSQTARILIADDEPVVARFIENALKLDGWSCETVASASEAYSRVCQTPFDVVISDVAMPDMTGLDLLDKIVAIRPESRVVLITGMGSSDLAKQAIRRGAFEYIEKPFEIEQLRRTVSEAIRDRRHDSGPDEPGWHFLKESASPPLLINRDPLTGLINHRCFHEELVKIRSRCRRRNHPVSVLLIDVDDFTNINTKYGHAFGDFALRELARRLRTACREEDIVSRYSGQQFAVAMIETDIRQAATLARRLRLLMTGNTIPYAEEDVQMAVCVGIAECDPGFIESESNLLQRATQALTQAKKQGGSVIICWDEMERMGPDGPLPDEDGIERMAEQFEQLNQQLRKSYIESTEAFIAAVEAKDPYTKRHSLTVATYAAALARTLQLDRVVVETIETAAILHDIGKIGIPDRILTKTERLTDEEFALIRQHPVMAVRILRRVSFLRAELPMILYHHEWWDGSGYPEGLSGEAIPFGARILHVADSIEAMLAERSYKGSYTLERVIEELQAGAGSQFDPQIVRAAVRWLQEDASQVLVTAEA